MNLPIPMSIQAWERGGGVKWAVAPQLIIRSVMSKIQGGNLTDYITNISTSGPHGRQCSEYYASLNKVIDMIYSVNSNTVSLQSYDF